MQDIKELLEKYKAGRRPPLDELVNEALLKVIQRGVAEEKLTPLGILLPNQSYPEGSSERWENGRYIDLKKTWEPHCSELRKWKNKDGVTIFEGRCKKREFELAGIADVQRKPLIYLCHGGLIDYALPVVVDEQTIAVLFAGQLRPVAGRMWSKDFVDNFATQGNVTGSEDAWAESNKRNKDIISEMRYSGDQHPPDLVALAKKARPLHPNQVTDILRDMQEASTQLSSLAQRTVLYELDIIRAHFTSKVASLLPVPDEDFWPRFSKFLSELAQFYGMDYSFLYMLRRENDEYMYSFTTVPDKFLGDKPPLLSSNAFFPISSNENCQPICYKPSEAKKSIFKSNHLFSSRSYVVPMMVNGPLGIVVMGCLDRKAPPRFGPPVLTFLQKQMQDISIILENRRQMQARDMYVTDIAHEVRSPLAAVLATAENLTRGSKKDVEYRSSRLLTRLRRLQWAVERFMMLDKLLTSRETLDRKLVPVYDVARECESELYDIAKENDIRIVVNQKALKTLPMVRTDREAFKHSLANLMHNAIKYGDPYTEVIVEGRSVGMGIKVDVEDMGIPVPGDAVPLLGQRHFRTQQAIKRDPTGSGIGLTLVWRFLKIVGGKMEVKSENVSIGRHHVIFSIYLPK